MVESNIIKKKNYLIILENYEIKNRPIKKKLHSKKGDTPSCFSRLEFI
jgi:hypothetical protein